MQHIAQRVTKRPKGVMVGTHLKGYFFNQLLTNI